MAAELETSIVSVERALEFIRVQPEAALQTGALARLKAAATSHGQPYSEWPSKGALSFRNVDMRYRPELGLVLRGLTLEIPANQRVGVVGRTGLFALLSWSSSGSLKRC